MAQPKATFDVDGVLFQSREAEFFAYVTEVHGVQGDLEVYRATHNWELAFNRAREEVTAWFREFGRSSHCPPPEHVPGALSGLQLLVERGYAVETVSQRPADDSMMLRELFERLFGSVRFQALHFVSGGLKHHVVRESGALVHVEDSLFMASNVMDKAQVPVIVFPHPFNWHHPRRQHLLYTEAHRGAAEGMQFLDWCVLWYKAWREIPDLVADIAEGRQVGRVVVPAT